MTDLTAREGATTLEHDDFCLQHALGLLVTSPDLAERAVQQGLSGLIPQLPSATELVLTSMLREQGGRIRLVAQILDERLRKNVMRFFPLTGSLLPSMLLEQSWRAFRALHDGMPWQSHRDCALAFGCHLESCPAARVSGSARAFDVFLYELAILRLHARVRATRIPSAEVAASQGYPAVAAMCEALLFQWSVSRAVLALRSGAGRDSVDELAAGPHSEGSEVLVFFRSWHDDQVRALRVSSMTLQLLARCDGASSMESVALSDSHRALRNLETVGLVRLLRLPVLAQSPLSVKEST